MKTKKHTNRFAVRLTVDFLSVLLAAFIIHPLDSFDHTWASAEEADVIVVDVDASEPDEMEVAAGTGYPHTQTFTITAYYSPLPCQNKYATGTYEGDIRLNGNGTNGADGTPVYPGMIAAPKSYAFGTKMYIPGVGITAVHDRGGAIVHSGERGQSHDRLDIWMGYGDKGLKRALQWGKRDVAVTMYGVTDSVSEEISLADFSPNEAIADCSGVAGDDNYDDIVVESVNEPVVQHQEAVVLAKAEEPKSDMKLPRDHRFVDSLSEGSVGAEVRKLQEELASLNFFMIETTGYYGELTTHAVFKFQQSQGLVGDMSSPGAGVFGPKTSDRLNEILASREYTNQLIAENNSSAGAQIASSPGKKLLSAELDMGYSGPEVRILQQFLMEEGYFDAGFTTDYFGDITRESLIKYQLANNIISHRDDIGAGRVGQATLRVINS